MVNRSPSTSSPSARTSPPPQHLQQWSEHPRLTLGAFGGLRIVPKRNRDGDVEELGWETAARQDHRLRLEVERGTGARLLTSPTADPRDEAEYLDLVGDPLRFANDATLLAGLHEIDPDLAIHPTIVLNAHHDSSQAAPSSRNGEPSRLLARFEPSHLNRGNCLASVAVRLETNDCANAVFWRKGDDVTKRPTAVGFGMCGPAVDRKGKRKAVDQDEHFALCEDSILSLHSPIQQIQAVPLATSSLDHGSPSLLAVRSDTSLELVHLCLPRPFDPGKPSLPSPPILARHSILGRDLAGRSIADCALGGISDGYGRPGEGLVVDVEGSLFGWNLGSSGPDLAATDRPSLFKLRLGPKRRADGFASYCGMSRVAFGGRRSTALVAMEDQVNLYDVRSPTDRLLLVGDGILARYVPYESSSTPTGPALVTSLLQRSPSFLPSSRSTPPASLGTATPWIHPVCTTRDVVWVDERMPGKEVLRWAHDRVGLEGKGVDRTLTIVEVPWVELVDDGSVDSDFSVPAEIHRLALTSRQSSLTTIYTTSTCPSYAPRSVLDPYSLPSGAGTHENFSKTTLEHERFWRNGFTASPFQRRTRSTAGRGEPGDGRRRNHEDGDAEMRDGSDSPRRGSDGDPRAGIDGGHRDALGWKILESGIRGEVFERDVIECEGLQREKGQERERGPIATRDETWNRDSRRSRIPEDKGFRPGRLDMSVVLEALEWDNLVGGVATQEGTESPQAAVGGLAERANDLVQATAREARDIDGDVGAITGLELVDLAASTTPTPTAERCSSDDEQEAQRTEIRIEPLPRPTSFIAPCEQPALSLVTPTAPVERDGFLSTLVASAPDSLRLFDSQQATRFDEFSPVPHALGSRRADLANRLRDLHGLADPSSPSYRACEHVAAELDLSSTIVLPRPVEPDEPTDTPNQPQPATEPLPRVRLSYLQPVLDPGQDSEAERDDDDLNGGRGERTGSEDFGPMASGRRRKKKPPLQSIGTRLLLAEWHVGSDPRSYTWSNPYEAEKEKDDPFSQSQHTQFRAERRKARRNKADDFDSSFRSSQPSMFNASSPLTSSSLHPSRFDFPSAFPSSSPASQSYFPSFGAPPSLNPVHEEPQSLSSSQDWTQVAATQPVISITAPSRFDDSARGPGSPLGPFGGGANSQIVPGAFGSRNAGGFGARGKEKEKEKEKKKAKKRVSGF
ncbi:hypothetical protein JCM10212_005692 [Sporobolomyces blumeae]